MKKILHTAAIAIFCLTVMYMGFVITNNEANPFNWDSLDRILVVVGAIIATGLVKVVTHE